MTISEKGTPAVIWTKGLTKKYGELTAVDHLDLTVFKGEVFGLLGPNGAGKTTTTLMLLGLTEPDGGEAIIKDLNCTRDSIEVKKAVGYLPDNVGFYSGMTGRENLRFTGRLNGLEGGALEEKIDELLVRVNMVKAADKKTGAYSRGMKQRLGIGIALFSRPKLLVLDEPTNGLDPIGIQELREMIRKFPEEGITVIVSSHILSEIAQTADHIGIIVNGELGYQGGMPEPDRLEKLFMEIAAKKSISLEASGRRQKEAR